MSSKFYSISCTNCGAPLSIRGGGSINSVTCEYCSSVLDMNNEYAVLSKFSNVQRPNLPFKLGMQGTLMDIEWTIIATVTYRTAFGDDEPWSELSLYSPLYGYAWLVYEEGNISFSKRVRDFDIYSWKKQKSPKRTLYRTGIYNLQDEAYNSYVSFVEGELSYIAKKGDKTECWDYKGVEGKSLSIERIKDELEVYFTQKLKAKEVYDSFGIKEDKYKDFPTEDVEIEPIEFSQNTLISLGAIFLVMFISIFTGSTIYTNNKNSKDINSSFVVTSGAFVNRVDISTLSYSDNLAKLSMSIKRVDDYGDRESIFTMDLNKSFFANSDYNRTYNLYDNHIEVYIDLDEGNYTIELHNIKKVNVTIEQRYMRLSHIITMLVLYILFGILNVIVKITTNTKILYGIMLFILGSYFISFGLTVIVFVAYSIFYQYSHSKGVKK